MTMPRLLPLLPLTLALAGCIDDRAAFEVDRNQVITVIREQHYVWSKSVEFSLVVARMPDCMRRHPIGEGTAQSVVEIGQYYADTFVVKIDDRLYAAETTTCEKLQRLKALPQDGLGVVKGAFREVDGKWTFVPAAAPRSAAK